MPKFTVKTPVISPEGGTYAGSVSVAIACASPDAVIYYTTDGSTPARSSARYTGAFTVAPTITGASAIPPAAGTGTKPGRGAAPAKPGAGNTAKPGSKAEPGNSAAQEAGPDAAKPFIKGENGRTYWDVIRAEEEKAAEGSVINVDMNGATVVPGDVFDRIRGRDVTITFDMDNGVIWSVDGKSIATDKAGDIDFSVKTGTDAIPADVINSVAGESFHIQISIAHEGEFGFTAVLSINLGRENAGYTAILYRYNESAGELAFICADEVARDGTAEFTFTHASDYVAAIDTEPVAGKEGMGSAAEAPKYR